MCGYRRTPIRRSGAPSAATSEETGATSLGTSVFRWLPRPCLASGSRRKRGDAGRLRCREVDIDVSSGAVLGRRAQRSREHLVETSSSLSRAVESRWLERCRHLRVLRGRTARPSVSSGVGSAGVVPGAPAAPRSRRRHRLRCGSGPCRPSHSGRQEVLQGCRQHLAALLTGRGRTTAPGSCPIFAVVPARRGRWRRGAPGLAWRGRGDWSRRPRTGEDSPDPALGRPRRPRSSIQAPKSAGLTSSDLVVGRSQSTSPSPGCGTRPGSAPPSGQPTVEGVEDRDRGRPEDDDEQRRQDAEDQREEDLHRAPSAPAPRRAGCA